MAGLTLGPTSGSKRQAIEMPQGEGPPKRGGSLKTPAWATSLGLGALSPFELSKPAAAASTASSGSVRSMGGELQRASRGASELSLSFAANAQHGHANSYEEAPTSDLQLQPLVVERAWSLGPIVPLAHPVLPQPAPDPESTVFKPPPLTHLNGQAKQHLTLLKEVRAKVAQALNHRISRRVSAGKLTSQAADALQRMSASRLVKPVSIALQRYCAAKRYFAEGQACLAYTPLCDGTGALGLFTRDVTVITDSLANAIVKSAVTAEAQLAKQQQQQLQQAAANKAAQQQAAPPRLKEPEQLLHGGESQGGDNGLAVCMARCSAEEEQRQTGVAEGPGDGGADPSTADKVFRRPPVSAPHRMSFCGPGVSGGMEAAAACAGGGRRGSGGGSWGGGLASPSTPRSTAAIDLGLVTTSDLFQPTLRSCDSTPPTPRLFPGPPQAQAGSGSAAERAGSGSSGPLTLEREQSRSDGAPAIVRPALQQVLLHHCSSSTAWASAPPQQQQQEQPPMTHSAPPPADGAAAAAAQLPTSSLMGPAAAGEAAAAAPAISVVSCVSPPVAALSSAESPPKEAEATTAAPMPCRNDASPHAAVAAEAERGGLEASISISPPTFNALDFALASPGLGLPLPLLTPTAATAPSGVLAPSPCPSSTPVAQASSGGLPAAEQAAEAAGAVDTAPGGASGGDAEACVTCPLTSAMAGTFQDGLEAIDWYAAVQDAYGLDPEELLLQQGGQAEDAEEDEEGDGHGHGGRGGKDAGGQGDGAGGEEEEEDEEEEEQQYVQHPRQGLWGTRGSLGGGMRPMLQMSPRVS